MSRHLRDADPVSAALERLRRVHGGLLRPADVVRAAADPDSPLHARFTWDDTEAAERWRLHQASELIRVHVVVIDPEREPVRAYVSLTEDRGGAGYRATLDVLSDDDMRHRLLRQALVELAAWRRRYAALSELAEVFEAVERASGEGTSAA